MSSVAVVLLSGGMDSAACLVWASREYHRDDLLALSVLYGQPHRDAEMFAAGTTAARLGVQWLRIHAGNVFPPAHAMADSPVIPGRNATMLALAAGHAAARWPGRPIDLWIGACADDASGFTDCRLTFFSAQTAALSMAVGVPVRIKSPLVHVTKSEMVRMAIDDPELMTELRESFSCYRGTVCGECNACRVRSAAFAAHGVEDRQSVPVMFGGDPSRERK